jgi:hypothetical protein
VTDGLGPEARALLEAAREGMSPDAATVRRMRGKIGHATAAGTATAGIAVAAKLFVVGVIAAVVAAGVYVERRRAAHAAQVAAPSAGPVAVESPPVVAAPPRVAPAVVARPRVAPEVAASAAPVSPAARVVIGESPPAEPPPRRIALASAPARATAPATRRPAGAVPASVAKSPPPSPPRGAIDLAREVELVDLAMSALGRGDPATALATAQRHASETGGHGQLAEDAAAIEIEALCQLHEPSRTAKLAAFDARFPHSAQRSRLDGSCR